MFSKDGGEGGGAETTAGSGWLPPSAPTSVLSPRAEPQRPVYTVVAEERAVDNDDVIFALDEDAKTEELLRGGAEEKRRYYHEDFDSSLGDSSEELEPDPLPTRETGAAAKPTSRMPAHTRTAPRAHGAPRANTSARLPSASIAASLPVAISRGFWPPREAIDSLPDQDESLEDGDAQHEDGVGDLRARTIMPQRARRDEDDMYRSIQAYSRSIQPADDPERLFGERPRRRYRTGRDSGGACVGDLHMGGSPPAAAAESGHDTPPASAERDGATPGAVHAGAAAHSVELPMGGADMADGGQRPRIIVPASLAASNLVSR